MVIKLLEAQLEINSRSPLHLFIPLAINTQFISSSETEQLESLFWESAAINGSEKISISSYNFHTQEKHITQYCNNLKHMLIIQKQVNFVAWYLSFDPSVYENWKLLHTEFIVLLPYKN